MSRRERRDSDSRRHYYRFDREPSPKRSRRDGKPEAERLPSDNNVGEHADREQKHRRRLQDALPLEASEAPDSKVENGAVVRQTERKHDASHGEEKRSSDPTEVPKSRSYFQVLCWFLNMHFFCWFPNGFSMI
ncbi:hypothetical protein SLEP1_g35778 [Rubroshorea leprosula]|uniref:Uncharacterized protein n=1 Tax=Rubroshorea leprosula TaxID=152421 RepID=A0AAV5KPB9_9ROSI|nr:hypothetical protein SLEP1_g35778 [Rubroshorea leprosula]